DRRYLAVCAPGRSRGRLGGRRSRTESGLEPVRIHARILGPQRGRRSDRRELQLAQSGERCAHLDPRMRAAQAERVRAIVDWLNSPGGTLVHWEKVACGAFSDVPALPAAQGATFVAYSSAIRRSRSARWSSRPP